MIEHGVMSKKKASNFFSTSEKNEDKGMFALVGMGKKRWSIKHQILNQRRGNVQIV